MDKLLKQEDSLIDLEVVALGIEHLKSCLSLDLITLGQLWSSKQWEEELSNTDRFRYGVIKSQELIAFSCAWVVTDELHITALAVHPKFRRLGLAEKLVSKMLYESRIINLKSSTLEVKSENYAAISFYRKMGYRTLGKRKKLYRDGSDGIIFWKFLQG